MRFEKLQGSQVSLAEIIRILALIEAPPNLRDTPQPGDRRDKPFDQWFDGGAICNPTGGASEYALDDGVHVRGRGLGPRLWLQIEWPDGRSVTVEQGSDNAN